MASSGGSNSSSSSAIRALGMELKGLQDDPLEGIRARLVNDENMFEWEVALFGPPDTLYQGGYFKAHMKFPRDYPYSPPSVRFVTKVWHPNVYENGDLCISILHPPVDDPQSGELPCERWNPTQNVRTILLSVVSLLNEPNTFSPANVDASVMFRRWKESKGKDKEYEHIIRRQVTASRADAERDGVEVPTTMEEYCKKPNGSSSGLGGGSGHAGLDSHDIGSMDMDLYDDYVDMIDDDEDDDDDIDDEEEEEGQEGDGDGKQQLQDVVHQNGTEKL